MAISFIQYSAATATDGALVGVDLMATFGTASEVAIQIVKLGYGTAATTTLVATGQGLPVATGAILDVEQAASATSPVSIASAVPLGVSATIPVSVGAYTATGQVLTSALSSATQPVSVGTWTATGQVLTSPLSTATQPVSVATWTATGNVQVVQNTATNLNVIAKQLGRYSSQRTEYLNITATTVATLATAPGSNTFSDLVALYVSNHATSPQSISIRDTSTATRFNPMLAADGGGFIWQPVDPTRQKTVNNAWTVQTSAATGIKVTAQFQRAT